MTFIKSLFILWATTLIFANDMTGTWVCQVPNQSGGLDAYALTLTSNGGKKMKGEFISFENSGQVKGKLGKHPSQLKLAGKTVGGDRVAINLTIQANTLKGVLHLPALDAKIPFTGKRSKIEGSAAIGMYPCKISPLEPAHILKRHLPAALESRIVPRIRQAIEKWAIVGMSSAIIKDGEMVDVRSYGWEDQHQGIPATSDTMYRWASIAKSLTATIAMKLVEEGSLDLDEDVRSYVPEYPEQSGVITSRQLLNHTSGVVHYHRGKVLGIQREYNELHPFGNVINALDKFNQSQLLFPPGLKFSYSTPGYVLLGAVLQRAAQKPFAELIQKYIAEPLNLTTLQPDHAWIEIPHRTVGYRQMDEHTSVNTPAYPVSWKLPAGGLISTITDLGGFAQGILDGRLVSKESWQTMWQPTNLPGGFQTNYGFGFNMGKMHGQKVVWHSGAQNKTATFMLLCPEAKAGVVLMCNTQGTRLEKLGEDILGMVLQF